MTAPASILATFAQPATRLAMGDAAGAAMGGFEALLAMLSQSLQAGQARPEGDATAAPSTDTPSDPDDLAALLSQAGPSAWLAQALGQTTPAETAAPAAATAAQAEPTMLAPMTRAGPDEEAASGDQSPRAKSGGLDTGAVETPPPSQTFEAPDAPPLAWRKPMTDPQAAQLAARPQPVVAPPAAPAPAVDAAVALQVLAAEAEAAARPATDTTPAAAETAAAPPVVPQPVDAKASAAPRKSAADKTAKVEASDARPMTSPVEAAEAADADPLAADLAPAELAARDEEAPAAPARTGETPVQSLATRLETVAANASALAHQVRGAPETVAKLAAGILDKLEGRSTRFDLQLDPHGLGKVDVSVEIASDGKLTAQLGFDSQLGLGELRGRAQELRAALEQAGFTLADNALSFEFSERGRQQAGDTQNSNSDQAGKAFVRAMGALDEELAAVPTRYQARRGLDLLI